PRLRRLTGLSPLRAP
uniref:Beta-campsomerin n=1 Tax=Campsomeriella annulata TaxID=1574124 RepID=CAMP_CAMAN|nr:RecName: Full=Beta-campsomerin; AltName: Full=Bradykinin-related peptide; Contains: RecName: Full=Alpha-campsomerin [Campsomeriella annulata]